MTFNKFLVRPLVAALAFALCGIPDALAQSPTIAAPPTGVSQDATQQPIQPSTTQQQNWPTQESAPNSATPAAPNATAPSTTAPGASAPDAAQQPAPTQPSTAPDASQRERVVLGPDGQPQPSSAQPNRGTTVDPSAGPLAPAPSASPAAPTATPEEQTKAPNSPQPQTEPAQQPPAAKQQPSPEPLGTAAAEGVKTAGNGASKPAGSAIAPAKQNRKRSLLIKLGAIAAVGVAVGTVAALSRGTPGNPPNTTASASTR